MRGGPFDERRVEQDLAWRQIWHTKALDERLEGNLAKFSTGLADRGELGTGRDGRSNVIDARHHHVAWHVEPQATQVF